MEKQYYLPDIESGTNYSCTKKEYESFMNMWYLLKPSIKGMSKPIIVGTAGEMENNNNLKEMFYNSK